jgi:hypothetical protein
MIARLVALVVFALFGSGALLSSGLVVDVLGDGAPCHCCEEASAASAVANAPLDDASSARDEDPREAPGGCDGCPAGCPSCHCSKIPSALAPARSVSFSVQDLRATTPLRMAKARSPSQAHPGSVFRPPRLARSVV